jgi:hypothetical protein
MIFPSLLHGITYLFSQPTPAALRELLAQVNYQQGSPSTDSRIQEEGNGELWSGDNMNTLGDIFGDTVKKKEKEVLWIGFKI